MLLDHGRPANSAPEATSNSNCFVTASPIDSSIANPTGLTAEHLFFDSDLREIVRWQDNAQTESCYVVEKKAGWDQPFAPFAILPSDAECFVDATDSLEHDWYYRVYAATANARSTFSNEGTGSTIIIDTATPPAPPTPTRPPTSTPIAGCTVDAQASPTPEPTPETPFPTPMFTRAVRGDLNCDLIVDPRDTDPILRHEADIPRGDASCAVGPYDLTCDDVTDARDVLAILLYSAGLDSRLPDGCPSLG